MPTRDDSGARAINDLAEKLETLTDALLAQRRELGDLPTIVNRAIAGTESLARDVQRADELARRVAIEFQTYREQTGIKIALLEQTAEMAGAAGGRRAAAVWGIISAVAATVISTLVGMIWAVKK